MLLFFSPGSPYARMIRIAWRDRAIGGIEEREATLRDPGSVLLAHNPSGRVPTLVLDDGTALGETLLILTHLDRLHAAAPLIPQTQAGLAELGRAMGLLDGIAVWNRELVQKGMSPMGREALDGAKRKMGAEQRTDVISFADMIDFDEGRIL